MKKSLILALSAAFIFNMANISDVAASDINKTDCGYALRGAGAVKKPSRNYPDEPNFPRHRSWDSDEDYSSKNRRQPPPPQYDPQPAPPFLTDKQKKNWRKQEAEREQWFDEARTRWQRENQSSSKK